MLFQLRKDILAFPDPALAEEDGLLAIGGDLSPERLRLAYDSGIFPWYNEDEPILWYAPPERCVLFPGKVKVSKSMQRVINKQIFDVTVNQAFEAVLQHCARIPRKGQDGTWIHRDMQEAYTALHRLGIAKSIEIWKDGKLAGGLYGVTTKHIFCGESMFSLEPNASKLALIMLCKMPYELIDCQVPNSHLRSMGAEMISRHDYMKYLE